MGFKKDFIWGAAAAAYQIEGAAFEDGKGLSVWDMVCKKDGFVEAGQNGNISCDHYHRYKEDIAIMKKIGLQAYRMSISWPRVIPNGIGEVNEKGLDFYDRLVDELLENNIIPFITLFHWDFPYELYKRGGWLNTESSEWFYEYTTVIVKRLSDRVNNWLTLNEPQCFIGLGHFTGEHAPGLKLSFSEVLAAGHNALLAHGKAVKAIRQFSKHKAVIGYAPLADVWYPETNDPQNIEMARKKMFSIDKIGCFNNTWWMDPVYLGEYPQDGLKLFEEFLPNIKQDDFKIINQEIDYFDTNIYSGSPVKIMQNEKLIFEVGYPETFMNWPVTPKALYWGPKFLYERYCKPIVITENGMANCDWVSLDGKVHDPQRIDFLHRYLLEYRNAAEDGVPINGYFCWSLMDNFEWAYGYNKRFGLVHVDYKTLKRTIKDSAYWYSDVIKTNGNSL